MKLGLEGKVALVAAGSKGIGRAISLALAEERVNLAISARGMDSLNRTVSDIKDTGGKAIAIQADVTNSVDVDRMVSETISAFGRLDILVASAGGPPSKGFEATTDEDWSNAVNLNLLSTVRLLRQSLDHLVATRGNVITISSISVKQPVKGLILSNAVRAAGIGLIKTLADELGGRDVRLNNILPGMILTDRARQLAESRANAEGKTAQEIMQATEEAIPLGRYGSPDEIANLAVFLASDAASYITGTSILCDGGLYRGLY